MSLSDVRLLVVEDEAHLAFGLQTNFELEGFQVDVAENLRQARDRLRPDHGYGLVVLDVMLPDGLGFELCQELRDRGDFTPVLALTALGHIEDRVTGLEAGADDYLTKPFELDELLARVRALIRRQRWHAPALEARTSFGRVSVDFERHEVSVDGEPVQLTALELDLLRYFVHHPGRVVSRKELLVEVWKLADWPNTRTVDNFILRLRRHFERDPARPVHFQSVRGAGYRFVPDP